MKTIEIKSIYGKVLFTHTCENNTILITLLEATRSYADLSYANLSYADLSGADLRGADLRGINLSGANLSDANLSDARFNENTAFFTMQCPTEGSFIAWKKVVGGMILKLRVTENAKRSSATTLKCRCSEAEVLDIQDIDGNSLNISEVSSKYDDAFVYRKGEIVRVEDFDEDRWNECSTGIHFFIDRAMAVNYN